MFVYQRKSIWKVIKILYKGIYNTQYNIFFFLKLWFTLIYVLVLGLYYSILFWLPFCFFQIISSTIWPHRSKFVGQIHIKKWYYKKKLGSKTLLMMALHQEHVMKRKKMSITFEMSYVFKPRVDLQHNCLLSKIFQNSFWFIMIPVWTRIKLLFQYYKLISLKD